MSNSSNFTPGQAKALSGRIALTISEIGHVPSFKNNKSIFRNRATGKPFIATQPQRKAWMDRATQLIEYQLLSAFQTITHATSTAQPLHFWIASSVPLDDSWQWVNELHVTILRVPKGEEGAAITIDAVNNQQERKTQ